jgi:hypothetical protein
MVILIGMLKIELLFKIEATEFTVSKTGFFLNLRYSSKYEIYNELQCNYGLNLMGSIRSHD